MTAPWIVYGLVDPRDGRVRYVGRTRNDGRRLKQHASNARGHAKKLGAWKEELRQCGAGPCQPKILQECRSMRDVRAAERRWVLKGRAQGWDLLNSTPGGEPSGDTRQALADVRREIRKHEKKVSESSGYFPPRVPRRQLRLDQEIYLMERILRVAVSKKISPQRVLQIFMEWALDAFESAPRRVAKRSQK